MSEGLPLPNTIRKKKKKSHDSYELKHQETLKVSRHQVTSCHTSKEVNTG